MTPQNATGHDAAHGNRADGNQRRQLRQAFGRFPTGVTVVTSKDTQGKPLGFTANSFTSVSLEPPLLLVCLAKSSSNLENFVRAGRFAVNILGEDQKDISDRFASKIADRFAETRWTLGQQGMPIIDNAVAWFECATDQLLEAGDHVILVGKILDFHDYDARPLAYLGGHYLDLGLGESAANSATSGGDIRVGCLLEHGERLVLQKEEDGWALPMGEAAFGLREGRAALSKHLAKWGISANIGQLYSIFDVQQSRSTWFVFLGSVETVPKNRNLKVFAIDELPLQQIKTPFFQSIIKRFQAEKIHSRFGIYVDDVDQPGTIQKTDQGGVPEQAHSAGDSAP